MSAVALAVDACGPQENPTGADGPWVGTITSEGDVTTVVNESGSVWGGEVELEETLSIGAEVGDESYLLGQVGAVGATTERIYVLDRQLSVVRAYNMNGTHLFDIGREGQGPGELDRPSRMGIDPDGRVIVQDGRRVSVFDLDDNLTETWPYRGRGPAPLVVAFDGTAFVSWRWNDGEVRHSGLAGIAPDGTEGRRVTGPTNDTEPWQLSAVQGNREIGIGVMYGPRAHFAVLASGAVVRGVGDGYSFEVERGDGIRMAVKRTVDLPTVPDAYRDWFTDYWTTWMRSMQPDWSWDVDPVPEYVPAFDQFFGDRYGRIWVGRVIGIREVAGCNPSTAAEGRACWRDVRGFDVFDEESGRFLGQVGVPAGATPRHRPGFLEDGFLLVAEDEAGTIMVKRYRLVLPGKR